MTCTWCPYALEGSEVTSEMCEVCPYRQGKPVTLRWNDGKWEIATDQDVNVDVTWKLTVEDVQYGWICPRCRTVNAPWMPYCCNCSRAVKEHEVKLKTLNEVVEKVKKISEDIENDPKTRELAEKYQREYGTLTLEKDI